MSGTIAKVFAWLQFLVVTLFTLVAAKGVPNTPQEWGALIASFFVAIATHHASKSSATTGIIIAVLLVLFAPVSGHAQATSTSSTTTTTQPPSLTSSAYNVQVTGGFSQIAGASTNNGGFTSEALSIGKHWTAREDNYVLTNPAIVIALAGGEYRTSINNIFKNLSGMYPIINNMTLFANTELGAATGSGVHKFAWGIGGGIDEQVNSTLVMRLLDVKYVRSSLLPNGQATLGNYVQLETGLGFQF